MNKYSYKINGTKRLKYIEASGFEIIYGDCADYVRFYKDNGQSRETIAWVNHELITSEILLVPKVKKAKTIPMRKVGAGK